jgi:hypothetical protein
MAISDTSPNVDNYFLGKGVVYWMGTDDTAYRDVGNCPTFEFTPAIDEIQHYSARGGVKTLDRTIVTQQTATLKLVLEEFTSANQALAFMSGAPDDAVDLTATADTSTDKTLASISPTTGLVTGRRYGVSGTGIADGTTGVYTGSGAMALDIATTATGSGVSVAIVADIAMTVFAESQITGAIKLIGTNDVGSRVTFEALNVILKPSAAVALIGEDLGQLELTADVYQDNYGNFAQVYLKLDY